VTVVQGMNPMTNPFAIMLDSHEALRASIRVQQRHLEAGDVYGFSTMWKTFHKALAVHVAMEDRAMFPLLDEVGDLATSKAGLPGEHAEDLRLALAVDAALLTDHSRVRAVWTVWRDEHLDHLEHEENVMMPLTMKTAATPEARARVVHERLLVPNESMHNFDWYIGWVIHMLDAYGSTSQPPEVAVRVFAWGLQHACTRAQWNRYRPIVRQQCSRETWNECAEKFGLDGDGALGTAN
jgi:hypothetical protein